VSTPAPEPQWQEALRRDAVQAPLRPRLPLWAGDAVIGSVEADFFSKTGHKPAPDGALPLSKTQRHGVGGWQLEGDPTAALAQIALALHEAGLAGAWRDEQLAVTGETGERVATVERAAVRPLGIKTFAVHLAATTADGSHWVQQRALTKSNDPGLWDTLMGGMIAASESVKHALERETWEEAGLRMGQLQRLGYGGLVGTRRPSRDGGGSGYVVEDIHWFRCVLADDVEPCNRDGEVSQFALLSPQALCTRLQQGEFTLEAALVLCAAGLAPR
jgi:8-oxo-dGTP pyrophosphatase MutT (NUDIX family)